jgi:hypothetical protein
LLGDVSVELVFEVSLDGRGSCSDLERIAHQVEQEREEHVSDVSIEA